MAKLKLVIGGTHGEVRRQIEARRRELGRVVSQLQRRDAMPPHARRRCEVRLARLAAQLRRLRRALLRKKGARV